MTRRHCQWLRRCFSSAVCGTLLLANPAGAISVSISDNVVVLNHQQRSAEIQLLSMSPAPVEFAIQPAELPASVQDGRAYLRWSPPRTLVPANRAVPLRMVFRPPADLPPGEYVVRLLVQSSPSLLAPNTLDAQGALSMGVAIQPVLPITVYLRHQVVQPELTLEGFRTSADTPAGYFTVSKPPEAISFIGTLALVGQHSGEVLNQGRLRLGQTVDRLQIQVPLSAAARTEPTCLEIWPTFPPQGHPQHRLCSG